MASGLKIIVAFIQIKYGEKNGRLRNDNIKILFMEQVPRSINDSIYTSSYGREEGSSGAYSDSINNNKVDISNELSDPHYTICIGK